MPREVPTGPGDLPAPLGGFAAGLPTDLRDVSAAVRSAARHRVLMAGMFPENAER